MATGRLKNVVRHLYHLSSQAEFETSSDQQLLQRFVAQRDERAFAALLRRHGAMVWGVCRRVLGQCHDVEDAFQNTFLTLLRQAGSIRWRESIEGWLHNVAYNLATKAKVARERRRAYEERRATMQSESYAVPDCPWELPEVLDKELQQVPEKYRSPLILCYLEGLTWTQAAQRLGISLRTLEWRLSQGRERLRQRLTKRGMDLGPMTLLAVLSPGATFRQVPAELLATTLQAARMLLKSPNGVGTGITTQAAWLIQEILGKYPMKTKLLLGMLLTLITVGGGVLSYSAWVQPQEQQPEEQPRVASQAPATSETLPTRTDCYGDPLPPGALARLGTVRFRPCSNINLLAFTLDGKGLLTAGNGKPISLWERETGKLLRRFGDFPNYSPNFCDATLAANGRIVTVWKAVHPWSTPGVPEDVLYVWETATGKLLRQFKGLSSRRRYAISPDSQLLATDLEGKFGLWEIATGRQLWEHQLKEGGEWVEAVAFSPDSNSIASFAFERDKNGKEKSSIRWWEARTGRLLRTWSDLGQRRIHHIVFSPDNRWLIVQSYDDIHVLDRITGKVRPLGETAHGMACSPNGTMVATYRNQGALILWDMATGKELRRLPKFRPRGHGHIVFSPDGTILAGTTEEGNCLWDVATGKELRRCQNSRQTWGVLAFSPDGKILAGIEGAALSFWEAASGKKLPQPREYQGFVDSVAFTPDGKSLVSIESDEYREGVVHVWDAQSGQQRLPLPKGAMQLSSYILKTGFSPDGKILAAGLDRWVPGKKSKYIDLWEAATGRKLQRLENPSEDEFPDGLVFSADGKFLAYGLSPPKENNYYTILWELATGKRLHHCFPGRAGMFSPDGTILVTEQEDRQDNRRVYCLWEIATGKKLRDIKGNNILWIGNGNVEFSYPSALAFSPNGQALLVTNNYSMDNKDKTKIQLYPLCRDHQLGVRVKTPRTLLEIDGGISNLEFSPDGKMLAASASWGDGTVSLWETATGKVRGRFHGHNDGVPCLAFSPDGRRLASGSSDTTILIWDVTGRLDDHGRLRTARLSAQSMEERWADLASTNAARAHQSLWTLVAGGAPTVAFCAKQLRPTPGVAAETLAQLLADLDSATYAVRQKARQRLEALGELAEPSLRRELDKQPSLELRRSVDYLLGQVEEQRARPSGEVLRGIRAIEVLEHIGTPAARQLLETLSRGAPGVRQTEEAKAALQRLSRRMVQQPNG